MPPEEIDLRPVTHITTDAIGQPGKRVFYLQGWLDERTITLIVEKIQIQSLAVGLEQFLSEVYDRFPDLPQASAEFNEDKIAQFCDGLRPGDPPDGQRYLRQAFRRYYQAFFEEDARRRAELILTANLEIGFHEQTRLQPEIAEAMDAGLVNITWFARRLIAAGYDLSGWLAFSRWLGRRLLGRVTAFDQAVTALLAAAQLQLRQVVTETMMTIQIPPDIIVKLGADLTAGFPESLRQPVDPDLCSLLAQIDPTPDSPAGSGAMDWADLPDRLNFICDLFRCYQETRSLFEAPFSAQQVDDLKAGRLPNGRL